MDKEYIFTLKFKLPQNAGPTDMLVGELYAKGCANTANAAKALP